MNSAEAVRGRRAIALLIMSAVLPGSAQYVAGNRRLGKYVLTGFLSLVVAAVLVGLGLWLFPGPFVAGLLGFAPIGKILCWLLFAGWVLLLLDAWRLGRPLSLVQQQRIVLTVIVAVLILVMGIATAFAASLFTAATNAADIFRGGGNDEAQAGRYNVLLLGVDASAERQGVRPDSINVASIDAETGRTVIFGLPRNLVGAPFPAGSPLADEFPDGFRCPDSTCMINAIYTYASDRPHLYPDVAEPGLTATTEAVEETLGLSINYYAMVDMQGFAKLIDAMGGVRVNVGKPIPIGGGSSPISGYIEEGDDVLLDGYHALWFGRSRAESSDYERMIRQKCLLSAMAKQLDPPTLASRFVELSEAGSDLVRTDVSHSKVADLTQLAIKAKQLPITTVNFSPPLITPGDPDYSKIRVVVEQKIAQAEQADQPAPTASQSQSAAPTQTVATATSQATQDEASTSEAVDPASICSVG
ncbi:MAG: transcriptional regulator [Arachnia propionica]|nr:MAG: transcriptional regulator [Arachnia propionica]